MYRRVVGGLRLEGVSPESKAAQEAIAYSLGHSWGRTDRTYGLIALCVSVIADSVKPGLNRQQVALPDYTPALLKTITKATNKWVGENIASVTLESFRRSRHETPGVEVTYCVNGGQQSTTFLIDLLPQWTGPHSAPKGVRYFLWKTTG